MAESLPKQRKESECEGCYFKKDCGGFRDREGRCPEWARNDSRHKFSMMSIRPFIIGYR